MSSTQTTTATTAGGESTPPSIRLTSSAAAPAATPDPRLPDRITHHISTLPKLSREQAGHLRHFHNLASQLDGDWSFFGCQEPGQEWLDALRYQLATMAYATGAAHFHRLPALRAPMRAVMRQLIRKMLRREVWGYWYLTSQSGVRVDPDLKALRRPWADPVKEENIMYSGHLLLMLALYGMLFDDDEFEKDGAIEFRWDPIFWGMGPESFKYSRSSLQQAILDEMEKNGWVGVCCEPNVVFVVCNQFPIVAMRYADVHLGTNVVDGVLEKYKAALKKKGMIGEDGYFSDMWQVRQDRAIPATEAAFTAWGATFMNGWNSEQVHTMYPSQALGTLTKREDGRVNVERPDVVAAFRELVQTQDADPAAAATRQAAFELANSRRKPGFPYTKPMFGYAIMWASEVGDEATLDGLLKHADTYLNPCWANGGLYYPRHDVQEDADGNWRFVDPFTGNGGVGYARLNVADGQKKMWEGAWTAAKVRRSVAVEDVSMAQNVDFLRCQWVDEAEMGCVGLVMTMRTWNGERVTIEPRITGLSAGRLDVYVDGAWTRSVVLEQAEDVALSFEVGGEESTVCILKA